MHEATESWAGPGNKAINLLGFDLVKFGAARPDYVL